MKILQVCPRYPPDVGGVETHVRRLSQELADAGHEVEVFATGVPGETRDGSIRVRRFPAIAPGNAYHWSSQLARTLRRRQDWDLVHAHNYHSFPSLHALRANGRAPFVFTAHFHGDGHTPLRRMLHVPYRPIGGALFREADAVIAVSAAEASRVEARFGRAPTRIIPNGVDLDDLQAEPGPRGPVLLALGRLERYKRVDLAIRALAHLPDDHRLEVIGTGADLPRLRGIARAEGVAGRVEFLGRLPREQVVERLRLARVLLSLSEHEAFGITVVEAVAAGASVVASPIPAHAELAEAFPGHVALLPTVEAQEIARAVTAAQRARAVPEGLARFSWPRVREATEAVYEEVL